MPTPRIAVSNGSPAATSEPKVITSTTAATATPITSVALCSPCACIASPPYSTARPAARAGSAAPASASRASGGQVAAP